MRARTLLRAIVERRLWPTPVFLAGAACLLLGLLALGAPYYTSSEVRDDQRKLRAMLHGRAMVVGASHGEGLELDKLGVAGENFSHGGQDLFEMAYIARSVRRKAPELRTLFVAVSYFSFAFDNAASAKRGVRDRIGRRIEMYSSFPRAAFIPGDGAEFLKGVLYPVVTRDHFRAGFMRLGARLLSSFVSTASAAPSIEASRAEPDDEQPEAAPDDIATEAESETESAAPAPAPAPKPRRKPHKDAAWYRAHARGRCRNYSALMRRMEDGHPGLESDTYRELLELTREFEQKNVDVVFFTPPYLPVYNECFDERMQRLMRDNIASITRTTHARYFDFSNSPDVNSHEGLFVDSDHLRDNGKLRFSHLLGRASGVGVPVTDPP
jgi:hypothetical protein